MSAQTNIAPDQSRDETASVLELAHFPAAAIRFAFTETSIKAAQFQLLPGVIYEPEMLERGLVWQEQYLLSAGASVTLTAGVFIADQDSAQLQQTFESLAVQAGADRLNVLAVLRDESLLSTVSEFFERLGLAGKILLAPEAASHSAMLEIVAREARGDYVVMLEPGVMLNPQALYVFSKELQGIRPDVVFSNEVELDPKTLRAERFYRRAGFDKYSVLSSNTVGSVYFVATNRLRRLLADSLLRSGDASVLPWFLIARLGAEGVDVHFVPLALVTKTLAKKQGKAALPPIEDIQTLLASYARSIDLELASCDVHQSDAGLYVTPIPKAATGAVQVIIPFKNQVALLLKALASLELQDCAADLQITLVDNGSSAEERAQLDQFLTQYTLSSATSVMLDTEYFNFARLNNFGSEQGTSPYILFLNSDLELSASHVVSELRAWCALPDVGVVGGNLHYPDGQTQHAGINFASVRPMNVATAEHYDYLFREVNGVTFAMAMVKREAYFSSGGLDECLCPNGFGDALFCNELERRGYRTLYTPRATATHFESKSRGRSPEDLELLEMSRAGLPIADCFADFEASKQPMVVNVTMPSAGSFNRVVQGISRSPRLLRAANVVANVVIPAAQIASRINRKTKRRQS